MVSVKYVNKVRAKIMLTIEQEIDLVFLCIYFHKVANNFFFLFAENIPTLEN